MKGNLFFKVITFTISLAILSALILIPKIKAQIITKDLYSSNLSILPSWSQNQHLWRLANPSMNLWLQNQNWFHYQTNFYNPLLNKTIFSGDQYWYSLNQPYSYRPYSQNLFMDINMSWTRDLLFTTDVTTFPYQFRYPFFTMIPPSRQQTTIQKTAQVDEKNNKSVTIITKIFEGNYICEYGGIQIDVGIDDNKNGILDLSEIDNTEYICNNADILTSLVSITEEPEGINCENGGQRIESGIDINKNGTLDFDEITTTAYVCNRVIYIAPDNSIPVSVIYTEAAVKVPIGTLIQLSAWDSSDADGDTLTYNWSFISLPEDSTAIFSDSSSENPQFTVDMPGDYVIQLIVSDGKSSSEPDSVTVSVNNTNTVAFYHFDEEGGAEAIDSSGNELHGIIGGASRVDSKVGKGLLFGSLGAHVEIPAQGNVFETGEISIEAWIKLATLDTNETYQIVGDQVYGVKSYRFQINNGKLEFLLDIPWQTIISGNQILSTDEWYYVALTFNGSEVRIYINGIEDNYRSVSCLIPSSHNRLYVGALDSDGSNGFPGEIDELRISNIERSSEEIWDYYQSTN